MHVDDLFNDKKRINENLRKWFKEKWVRFGPDGKIRGDCARGDDSEGKPKCLPQSKAHALGKKGRKTAASRKRREDPNPERSGPAINVSTKPKSNEGITEEVKFVAARYIDEFADGEHWYVKGTPEVIKRFVQLANSLEDEAVKGTEYEPDKGMMAKVHAQLGDDSIPQWEIVQAQNLEAIKPIGNRVLQLLMQPDLAYGVQEFMSEFLWTLEEKGLALVTIEPEQGVAEGIFDFKKQPMPEHGDELKIGDRYVIFDDGGSYYGVSWIKKDRSEAYEEFNKSEYTDLNELKKAIWDEIKYQDQRGMAEDFTDDLDNIYAMHPQPEKSEQVVFLITGMTEDEFSNRWTDLPDPYQQEFGHDLPLWDADDLSSYPNLAVKRITFDQYVQLVGNYIKSEELAGSTMSRMKQGMTEGKHSCPECGGPAYEDRMLAEKQDACYHKVKSRYKVWPSAYASGALVQCRKKGAKNWGNKKTNESSYYHGDPKAEYFGLVVDGVVKFKFTDPVLAHEFASGYHEQFPDSSIKVKKINKTDNIEEDTGKSKLINQLLKIDPSLERNYLELANIDQLKIMLQQHQNKGKIYFDVPKSLSNESVLRSQFKFKHDSQGWYLNESNTNFKKLYLDAARAFRLK